MKELKNMIDKKSVKNKLLTNFNKELENKDFKEFTDSLNSTYETLSKYTSILKESCVEYTNCKNCKSILECKNKICGYAYLPNIKDNDVTFCYKKCKLKSELDNKNKYLDNVYTFNVPSEIRNASIKDIYKDDKNRHDVIKYIAKFIKEYDKNKNIKGLYLCGNFGSGKTYLISAMFNELAKKGIDSAIVFYPEYLRKLKSTFNSNDEYNNLFNKIKDAEILLIDDIGAENLTAWARDEVLCTILQHRMENHLVTFFTSNLNLDELKNHLKQVDNSSVKAERIIERIKQLTDYKEMISKNLRK